MIIKSTFAILDVKLGRITLAKRFKGKKNLVATPEDLRVPVTITGYIAGPWGKDDGTSQEFEVVVDKVVVKL